MKPIQTEIWNERGTTGLQAIIVLAVLAVAIYAAIQIFTVYDTYWTFEKHVKTLVRFAFVNLKGSRETQLFDQIIDMLDDMGVQYEKRNVRVNVDEAEKRITVDIWYSQTINVPLFPKPKHFHVHVQSADTVG